MVVQVLRMAPLSLNPLTLNSSVSLLAPAVLRDAKKTRVYSERAAYSPDCGKLSYLQRLPRLFRPDVSGRARWQGGELIRRQRAFEMLQTWHCALSEQLGIKGPLKPGSLLVTLHRHRSGRPWRWCCGRRHRPGGPCRRCCFRRHCLCGRRRWRRQRRWGASAGHRESPSSVRWPP